MAKGQKVCKCGVTVHGARTKICPACGVQMYVDAEEKPRIMVRFPDGYDLPEGQIRITEAPSGVPPIKLKPSEGEAFPGDDTLIDWATSVRQTALDGGRYLTNNALIYWARQQLNGDLRYAPNGDEMQYVKLVIGGLPDYSQRELVEV